jgi:hypothetical protein
MPAAYCAVSLAVTYQEIPFKTPKIAGMKMEKKLKIEKKARRSHLGQKK